MALTKDKGAVKKWSGGVLKIAVATDAGPATSLVAGDWEDMGYVQESKLTDTTEIETITDESGNTIAALEAVRDIKFTGLLMQSDKALIDYLRTTARGAFFSVYHYQGVVNGKHQEIVYPICVLKPMVELASGVKRIPFEFTVLKNETAIAFDEPAAALSNAELPTGAYAQGGTAGQNAIVVTANEYYHVTETAV